MRAVLAAIDFSKVSDLVIAHAASLARAWKGKVVLVTALVEPIFLKEYAPPPKRLANITIAHERAVRARLTRIAEQLRADFVPAEAVVRRGNAAQRILEEAEQHDAMCIVIGSHGRTAFFELVLGSTTQTVLKRAHLPVVVIPSKMR